MKTKELRMGKKWGSIVTDRITILRDAYEIQAAGTYLYEFIGTNLYYTFDKLVFEQDRDSFREIMKDGQAGAAYLLRLVRTEGELEWFVFEIEECTLAAVSFRVTHLSSAVKNSLDLQENNALLRNLLDLCDYLYFSYKADEDLFRISKVKREGDFPVYEGSLGHWIENGFHQGYLAKDQAKALHGFQEALEEKISYFEHTFSTSFFSQGKEMQSFLFKGNLCTREKEKLAVGIVMPLESDHIDMGASGLSFARDSLTGLFNKKDIEILARRNMRNNPDGMMALVIIDLDNFKTINDTKGHMFGDEILVRAAEVMKSAVGEKGYVGRIGGDEFMLVITATKDEDDLRNVLRSIRTEMTQLYKSKEAAFKTSCSIGCARYPLDAEEYKMLFKLADYALYMAKEKGKNRYIIYTPEKHGSPKFNEEDNLIFIKPLQNVPLIDFVGEVYEDVCQSNMSLQALLEKVRAYFNLERIVIYDGEGRRMEIVSGKSVARFDRLVTEAKYLQCEKYQGMFDSNGVVFCNNIKIVENRSQEAYEYLKGQHCLSMIQVRLKSQARKNLGIISFESCEDRRTWSSMDSKNFQLMARFLTKKVLENEKKMDEQ